MDGDRAAGPAVMVAPERDDLCAAGLPVASVSDGVAAA
jgi:hypothetical protein